VNNVEMYIIVGVAQYVDGVAAEDLGKG